MIVAVAVFFVARKVLFPRKAKRQKPPAAIPPSDLLKKRRKRS
jgi:hypothetical protein